MGKPVLFPPWEFIIDEMIARRWHSGDLVDRLGWKKIEVKLLLIGRKQITNEVAVELGQVFNTSAKLWMNLRDRYFNQYGLLSERTKEAVCKTAE